MTPRPASVTLNVTRAREGVREAIDVYGPHGDPLNPAEATKLARDLVTASAILDQLCPPPALRRPDDEEPF